jgi:hypothetical protein
VGRRGACLLLFGLILLIYGYAVAVSPLPPAASAALSVPLGVAPQVVWGGAWMVAGALAIAAAPLRPGPPRWGRDGTGFVAIILMSAWWALSYFAAQVLTWTGDLNAPRAVLGGLIWAAMAALLLVISGWPEAER